MQRKNETREEFNLRASASMKARYHKRRKEALEYLGNRCVDCYSTEQLEFDHVDQTQKEFAISRVIGSAPWSKITKELDKCVLRCESCHAYHTAFQKLKNFDALALASRLQT